MNCQSVVLHNDAIRYNLGMFLVDPKWREYSDVHDRWYYYINAVFYVWRGPTRKGIGEFAKLFNFSQPQMSQYMKKGGKIPTSKIALDKFARILGPELFEVFYMEPPSSSDLSFLPEPLRSITMEIRERSAENKVAPGSFEEQQLIDEIMKKYGYEHISTTDE